MPPTYTGGDSQAGAETGLDRTAATTPPPGPLSGYRVLDLAEGAGAFCARLLADMGADVIKIEGPAGDSSRHAGPFLQGRAGPDRSLSFWYLNAGKRGITLDLETGPGLRLLHRLAASADVVVEGFRPGCLDGMGAGYHELSTANPRLIMASITGFGQSGPHRDFSSCDIVAAALGGQMYACGDQDTPPLRLPDNQAHLAASLFAAAGILLALLARRVTGRGQHVDISIQECVAATLDHVLPRYLSQGEVARRQGSLHWSNAFRIFTCRDGHLLLSLLLNWETLVEWLDAEGMAADLKEARWLDSEERRRGLDHIVEVLERWTRGHNAADLAERGQLMGFPWAKVASMAEVADSTQLEARGFFITVEHPELGARFKYPGPAARLSRSPWRLRRRAPMLGEHNEEVLCGELSSPSTTETGKFEGALPLQNIRVLDFTRVLAGPYATRLLADFGAEVIKVQRPEELEADPFARAYYQAWNRSKLSVALDLSRPQGIALSRRLIAVSDVVVENFSPRVMANWGLDYQRIRGMRPGIIMVSLSTQGQTGPQRDYTGYGPTVHALSGLIHLTAFAPDRPLGPGHSYADHVAGLVAALATLAALEHRARTGEGQHIDVSATEAMCSLLGVSLMEWLANGHEPMAAGDRSFTAAPHGCYRCQGEEAWCAIGVSSEEEWKAFIQALGNPPWATEPRFATTSQRVEHSVELDRLVESWTREHTADEVMHILQRAGIAAGKVQDAGELASDPQLNARGFFVNMVSPRGERGTSDACPIRLSATPAAYRHAAPEPGRDTDRILGSLLGLTGEELAALRKLGVIA
ncbi:MAG: CoA transferase [Chloroflexota bacterium]